MMTWSNATGTDALYAFAYEGVFYPMWQRFVRSRPIRGRLRELEKSQWLPESELAATQVAALRALLEHAGRRVPYWRDLFRRTRFDPRGVRALSDLEALPVLTREIVQDRYGDLVDPARRAVNLRKGTSGTTGAPLKFEYDNESEAWRVATRLRAYGWTGYRMGMPTLYYGGAGAEPPPGLSARKIHLDRLLRREVYLDAARQDDASLQEVVDLLGRLRPHAVVAYTQALAPLARYFPERGLRSWPDARVLCAAEPLLPGDREAIVAAFGPHVFETYGSRETMLVACECDAHEGLHLSEENLVVEIARSGRVVAPGETGEVLVTDLHNYGMPFIRYANGDLAAMSAGGPCRCGRGLRRLARVEGRRADTLRDANGQPVVGTLFLSLLQVETPMLRALQVVQRQSGEVELKVVRGRDWDERRFAETVRRAEGYFKGLPVRVTHCAEIATAPSGKRRPIVVER